MDASHFESPLLALPNGARIVALPWREPEAVFAPLAKTPFALWLDTACEDRRSNHARYSFILSKPRRQFIGSGVASLAALKQSLDVPQAASVWADMPPALCAELPPFRGGLAGMLAYDLASHLEQNLTMGEGFLTPHIAMGLYDHVLAFDHAKRQCFGIASGLAQDKASMRARHAEAAIADMETQIRHAQDLPPPLPIAYHSRDCRSNFTRAAYEAAVDKIIELIYDGDLFQANLAQCFSVAMRDDDSDFDVYRRLRRHNRAPFAAFGHYGEWSLASSSPERFLRARHGILDACPIKGTAPRGSDTQSDARYADALRHDIKERAENTMIVDILRNDLAHSCVADSIEVPRLCEVQKFAHVQHLVSQVRGCLRADKTPFEALLAAFPGGSITGAPKIRAMQRIAELEPHARGAYCGALGYIGFDGAMDMNIMIRSVVMRARRLYYHAGGGITARSVAGREYDETLMKATGFFKSLGITDTSAVDTRAVDTCAVDTCAADTSAVGAAKR